MNKAVKLAAVATENKVPFPELPDHRLCNYRRVGRIPPEAILQVSLKLSAQFVSSQVVSAMAGASLHPQRYAAQQFFLVIFGDETYWKTFIMQMPVDVPSLNEDRGSVVVNLPPVLRQLLVTSDDGKDGKKKRITCHLTNGS